MRRVFYPMKTATRFLLSQRRFVEIAPDPGAVNTSATPEQTPPVPDAGDNSQPSTSADDDCQGVAV